MYTFRRVSTRYPPRSDRVKLNHVLKIQDVVSLQNCLFVHDFLNGKLPTCFNDYFTLVTDVHDLNITQKSLGCLYPPKNKTLKYGLSSIKKSVSLLLGISSLDFSTVI